jgi:predicted ArsR family transcriptional regulator
MARPDDGADSQIESLAALRDPLRRSIYKVVARADAPVSRDDVAAAVEVSRSLAAFHLDKLVAEGLLQTSFRRLSGRTGPGAGRPAKLYTRSDRQLDVSLPSREYELAARLLLQALDGGRVGAKQRLREVAHALGRDTGEREAERGGVPRGRRAALERLEPLLESLGYEPFEERETLCLRNCPFHALAQQSTETICGMNVALVGGILEGLAAKGLRADLAPAPGRCCVAVRPAPSR